MSLQNILKQAMQNEANLQVSKSNEIIKELQDAFAQGHVVVIDFNFEGQTFGFSLNNCEPHEFYKEVLDVVKYNYSYKIVKQQHIYNTIKRVYTYEDVYNAYYGSENKTILINFGDEMVVTIKLNSSGVYFNDLINKETNFNNIIVAIVE